jgi:hypothetical protein
MAALVEGDAFRERHSKGRVPTGERQAHMPVCARLLAKDKRSFEKG